MDMILMLAVVALLGICLALHTCIVEGKIIFLVWTIPRRCVVSGALS